MASSSSSKEKLERRENGTPMDLDQALPSLEETWKTLQDLQRKKMKLMLDISKTIRPDTHQQIQEINQRSEELMDAMKSTAKTVYESEKSKTKEDECIHLD